MAEIRIHLVPQNKRTVSTQVFSRKLPIDLQENIVGSKCAEWKNGLAWVLIGGLTSSMFLTLIVVPVVYYIFNLVMARFGLDKETIIELKETPRNELNTEIKDTLPENQKGDRALAS